MTEDTPTPATPTASGGERIAKVMARAGVASRRDAERMIVEGRVTVNGKKVTSPALDVLPTDKVTLDGTPIDAPQKTRLWLYYKPLGLVTSEKDEKGRQTVFDSLPEGLPRVMSVGRLDLNSEGLLLLTNDGGLKRRLELPETGWLRKYRVRVNGRPNDATFDPLRRGITIEGEEFQPMEVDLDRQQGANAWLTVGIREGRNREVRRAMAEIGLIVNRLIRVSYGPFRLNEMQPGDILEVKSKVLKDQLGERLLTGDETAEGPRRFGPGENARAGFAARRDGGDRPARGDSGDRPARPPRRDGEAPRKSFGDKPYRPREEGDARPPRKSFGDKPYRLREEGDARPPRKSFGDKPYRPREEGDARPPRAPRQDGNAPRKSFGDKPYRPREEGDARPPRKSFGDKPYRPREGDAPRKPRAEGAPGAGPRGGKPFGKPGGKPAGRPFGKPGGKPPRAPRS